MFIIIMDFIEIHWDQFVKHCKNHGIDNEEEIEKALDDLKFKHRR